MIIGVPKEVKPDEYRVAVTPAGVRQLTLAGHETLVQRGAGEGSGILDAEYEEAGARMVDTAGEAWGANIVAKVKEPIPSEYQFLREGLILYTFLHLAAAPELAKKLLETGTVAIGYETVQDQATGALPMLIPMSEVAGRMAVQAGARYLEKENGGRGVLLGGVPGVPPGKVVVLGAGIVGMNAVKISLGLGARTQVLDTNLTKLRMIDDIFGGRAETMYSNQHTVCAAIDDADMVIGAALVAGGRTPVLITRDMLADMKPGSVIVDVAVDQGGMAETTHPTSHSNPTYVVDSVTHYCVSNMPGAVPRTSTFALSNATFPGLLELAEKGIDKTMRSNYSMRMGLNVAEGMVTHPQVAESLELSYRFPEKWL
ncbi:MAG: alanine dehydrogenase [Nitrospinae bacterium]|nr:alanine dehydrogenase [Nitrospinota bacterium]